MPHEITPDEDRFLKEYEKETSLAYARLAQLVAQFMAWRIYEDFNEAKFPVLHQYQHRAKSLTSLKKNIQFRDMNTEDIKDLAGARLIFYFKDDLERFVDTRENDFSWWFGAESEVANIRGSRLANGTRQGVWPQVLDRLTKRERRRNSRAARPSAGGVDSQTIKTATQGKTTGYDAGKKIQGRKRHLLVDTSGLLRQVVVTAADVDDREGLKQVLTRLGASGVSRLRKLWVDGGYQGEAIRTWVAEVKKTHKIDLEVVANQGSGFAVIPRRWVVERTFAWLMNFRRHARDYEVLTHHSEAFIQIAMIHLLLKRIK